MSTKNNKPSKFKTFLIRIFIRIVGKTFRLRTFPNKFKKLGYWMSIGTITVTLLLKVLMLMNIIHTRIIAHMMPLPEILFILGLWFVMMSEEKVEDETVKLDRMQAARFSLSFPVLILIYSLISTKIWGPMPDKPQDFIMFSILFGYLLVYRFLKIQRDFNENND